MLFFSFFKPSSIVTAFPPHRLLRKPLTETPRHRENFSTGTPTSSSASAPHSDDTAATPRNPVRQNARPILGFDGFKSVISVIKYQEFMPDPSEISKAINCCRDHCGRCGTGLQHTLFRRSEPRPELQRRPSSESISGLKADKNAA
jgi:hypothetical protein